jgi:hypothetical protein
MKKPESWVAPTEKLRFSLPEILMKRIRITAMFILGSLMSCGSANCIPRGGEQKPPAVSYHTPVPTELPTREELKEWYFHPKDLAERDKLIHEQVGIYIIDLVEKLSMFRESALLRIFANQPSKATFQIMGVKFKLSIVLQKKGPKEPLIFIWRVQGEDAENRFDESHRFVLSPEGPEIDLIETRYEQDHKNRLCSR